jgi:hypothetical protein
MKARLMKSFHAVKNAERKITKRWFTRHAKQIYDELHSHQVVKIFDQLIKYFEFSFSHDWFHEFKKRSDINVRISIKMSQMINIIVDIIFICFII